MQVLLISRAWPPVVGGIENHNHALGRWLPRHVALRVLANPRGKRALPWFLPWAALFVLVTSPRDEVLLLGDGVLACVGWLVKLLRPGKTVVCVVHGLDLTWRQPLYQRLWLQRFMPALDGLIAVSAETRRVAVAAGLAVASIEIIPNGVDCTAFDGEPDRAALARCLGRPLDGDIVLLTAGRLARRKGAAWFIRHVLPRLPAQVRYVLAGAGPDEPAIRENIAAAGVADRVHLLGKVDDQTRDLLLASADLFIQPNIAVPGDMEGFGIAVLEAGASGLPVVASAIEGLLDAISPGDNGVLVRSGDADAWVEAVARLVDDPAARRALGQSAVAHVRRHHDWPVIAERYAKAIASFTALRGEGKNAVG